MWWNFLSSSNKTFFKGQADLFVMEKSCRCITLLDFTVFVSIHFSADFRRGCNRLFKPSCRKAITKTSWGFASGIAYVSDVSFLYLKTFPLLLTVFWFLPDSANAKDTCEDLTKIPLKTIWWGLKSIMGGLQP